MALGGGFGAGGRAPVVVVMGPSGSGKTTVGGLLAAELGVRFVDADALHPPANVAKMATGAPLDEADRGPWLEALRGELEAMVAAGRGGVLACSALRRSHRARLGVPGVAFAYLKAPPETLRRRLAERAGHFFPAALLDSQLEALEEPEGEGALTLDATRPPGELAAELARAFGAPAPRAPGGDRPEAVIFCGAQASGKSSFYAARFYDTHVRINLDMLRTRHRERLLLGACLEGGQPFVVDNTNLTPEDRARYVAPARARGFRVVGYYFASRLADCLARNAGRPPARRVPDAAVRGALGRLRLPAPAEGFDELYYVRLEADGHRVETWRDEG
ncbi:MAG TPA: gluconokinase, GntK/IdnK-type [Polyangiaceae bacterium]|nr:gluconokinase, GntK/IdnK-type [Polyangiaceae bacterium]